MRNCIILGSGRSGTSMLAGTLAESGYYMGETLMEPNASNPKGFFESYEVEAINGKLILPYVKRSEKAEMRIATSWLAQIPLRTKFTSQPELSEEMERLTNNQPFSFKDPRFSYTLPAWRPHLNNTVFICIFREPNVTAASIDKECRDKKYLEQVKMTRQRAEQVWRLMYRHIIDRHRHEGTWLFLHYDQVLQKEGLEKVEQILETTVNKDFPDTSLKRTRSDDPVSWFSRRVYRKLCTLADYRGA